MGNCVLKNSSRKANSSASFTTVSSHDGSMENYVMDGFEAGPVKRIRRPLTSRSVLNVQTDDLGQLYFLGKELGRGQFGVIRECSDRLTGELFACKSISKLKLTREQDVRDVRREIEILRLLSGHPNIVSLKGVYEDKAYVHIVMELCQGGELFTEIVKKGLYSEAEAAHLIKSLVEVVKYCNDMGVMHRDLKPENILFATSPSSPIKLIDFGLAVRFSRGQRFSGMVGSAYYIAPEVLNGYYSHEIDMWSAGVILYILLSGVPPFWEETDDGIFEEIKRGKVDFVSDPWPNVSIAAKDLIFGMLCPDAKARLTPEQVLQHPWILHHATFPGKSSGRTPGVNAIEITSPLQSIKDDNRDDVEEVAIGNQDLQLLPKKMLSFELSSTASEDSEGVLWKKKFPLELSSASKDIEGALIELPGDLQSRQTILIEHVLFGIAADDPSTPFETSRSHGKIPDVLGSPVSPLDLQYSLIKSPSPTSSTCTGEEPEDNESILIESPENLQARQGILTESRLGIVAADDASTPFEASHPSETILDFSPSSVSPLDRPSSLVTPPSPSTGQESSNATKSSMRSTQFITLEFPAYYRWNLPSVIAADTVLKALLAIRPTVPRPMDRKRARTPYGYRHEIVEEQEEEDRDLRSLIVHHPLGSGLPFAYLEEVRTAAAGGFGDASHKHKHHPLSLGQHLLDSKTFFPLIQMVF